MNEWLVVLRLSASNAIFRARTYICLPTYSIEDDENKKGKETKERKRNEIKELKCLIIRIDRPSL